MQIMYLDHWIHNLAHTRVGTYNIKVNSCTLIRSKTPQNRSYVDSICNILLSWNYFQKS